MKIAHLCLSCFYIDGFAYQENELVRQHMEDGHEVVVIASTETYNSENKLSYVQPSEYIGKEGARVIRLPYRRYLPHMLMKKLRMHPRVFDLLCEIRPEVIFFHGLCGWEINTVAKYKKKYPNVRVYVDSHEDYNNSARSFISKYVLHSLYYAPIIRRNAACFEKILCISLETMEFAKQVYSINESLIEYYPLGGRLVDDSDYVVRRDRGRQLAKTGPDQIILIQTGKLTRRKKILDTLSAFAATEGKDLRLVLAGSLDTEVADEAKAMLAADPRVIYLGWCSFEQLYDLLCAADVYVQPGTQSATMQMSLCARCAVILDDVLSHRPFVDGNGWAIQNTGDLITIFKEINNNSSVLSEMSAQSALIARRLLDYRTLASRIYQ